MNDTLIRWAIDTLENAGYKIQNSTETIQNTPWSTVYRFTADKGFFYLKKVPPALFIESTIIQLLKGNFSHLVPTVIAINTNDHCFLMKDGGIQLHKYLKIKFNAEVLIQTLMDYSSLQISSIKTVDDFISIGVPDWRVEKLPGLYYDLIERENLLLEDGLFKDEINQLRLQSSKLNDICDRLLNFQIPTHLAMLTSTLRTF